MAKLPFPCRVAVRENIAKVGFELQWRFAIVTQSTSKCFAPETFMFVLCMAADFWACFSWSGRSACLFKMFSAIILKQSYLVCTASLSQSKWQILYDCIQVEFNSLGPKVFPDLHITRNTIAPLYKLWQIRSMCISKRKWQQMVHVTMRNKAIKLQNLAFFHFCFF